jgi:hypothetical protein
MPSISDLLAGYSVGFGDFDGLQAVGVIMNRNDFMIRQQATGLPARVA